MDFQRFQHFCQTQFHLDRRAEGLSDSRAHPKIPPTSVFQAVFFLGVFGLGSLLRADQVLRTRAGRRLFGRKKPGVSDTTLSRSLEGFDLPSLHGLLQTIYLLARRVGPSRCPIRDGRWRIGGEYVRAGHIIVRQRGTKIHPGDNVGKGKDDTLYALLDGRIAFERLGKTRKRVSVYT